MVDHRLVGADSYRALKVSAEHAKAVSTEQARTDQNQEAGDVYLYTILMHCETWDEHRDGNGEEHHEALPHHEWPERRIVGRGVGGSLRTASLAQNSELGPEPPEKDQPECDAERPGEWEWHYHILNGDRWGKVNAAR